MGNRLVENGQADGEGRAFELMVCLWQILDFNEDEVEDAVSAHMKKFCARCKEEVRTSAARLAIGLSRKDNTKK